MLSLLSFICATLSSSNPGPYSTDFSSAATILAAWTPQEECAHCSSSSNFVSHITGKDKDECTNMTRAATTFSAATGMTHTTLALPTSMHTACSTKKQVCSSGHLTWNPPIVYGNFSVRAQWFNSATGKAVDTSTGFIGLDANDNIASITMGFHGAGWLGGNGEGAHRYQHGIYANVKQSHNRLYTNTTVDITTGLHEYGLLWSKDKVEWRFDGRVVRTVTDTTIIPFQPMQLRLHTRSGYCDHMKVGDSFTATFRSFSYTPLAPGPGPSPGPSPPTPGPSPPTPGPPGPAPGPAAQCAAANGILSPKTKHANICCAKSCGSCGGKDCGDKPGGSHDCCSNQITEDGRKCATVSAPCSTS